MPPAASEHPHTVDQLRAIRGRFADARHRHVRAEYLRGRTPGQRAADRFAAVVGSWPFILGQTAVLTLWIAFNVVAWIHHWDPYPFILLNLALSFQAAYAGPIIMMSQNRAALLDRLEAQADYRINQKAETEVEEILVRLQGLADELRTIRSHLEEPPD